MKAPRLISILLLLTIVHTTLSVDIPVSLNTIEEAIIHLNPTNFDHLVQMGRSERWFVMFHIGCPSCQEVYPIWNNFTKSRRGIRLGSVNSTAYPELAVKFSIKDFPSFVFFDEGKMELYQGENTFEAWNSFISKKKGSENINQTLPDLAPQETHIVELGQDNFDSFVLTPETRPWFIMFHTHCPECEAAFPSWREFAKSRKEGPNIGMIDCEKNPDLAKRFDIKAYPTFVYFDSDEQQIFNGERRIKEWSQYVDQKHNKNLAAETLVVNITNNTAPSNQGLSAEPSNALTPTPIPAPTPTQESAGAEAPSAEDAVVELTQDNFESLVNSANAGSWFIMFYAPWCPHCQRASPIWKEFANSIKEDVKVGMVDCVAHPALAGRYGIPGFPTFVYFEGGKTEVFNGERSVQSWSQFVDLKKNSGIAQAPAQQFIEGANDVAVHLTKDNFDSLVGDSTWFIMFYAPWCPNCQRATPVWNQLAQAKKDGAKIGMVNCVEQPELQGKYNVQGFPTFMFFDQGKTEIFNGPRTVEAWSQFIDEKKRPEVPSNAPVAPTPNSIIPEGRAPEPQPEVTQEPIKVGDFVRPTDTLNETRTGTPQPAIPAAEKLPEPAIGNLNAFNATIAAQNVSISTNEPIRRPIELTPGLPEPSIGDLNSLNRTYEARGSPTTAIEYQRPAAGSDETRPSIAVETQDKSGSEDTTVHYKEPMLVLGLVAALLLGSFFVLLCYQRFRSKYSPIETSDRDIELGEVANDSSNVKRDSFSNSMRF